MIIRILSKAKPRGHRFWTGCFLVLVLAIGLVIGVRCTRAVAPVTTLKTNQVERPAYLIVLNQSSCEWRITVTPVPQGEMRSWRVPVAASLEVDVSAGDYAVEQSMLGENEGSPEATRRFPLQVEAGQAYRWRLVTLLSNSSSEAQPVAPANGHE